MDLFQMINFIIIIHYFLYYYYEYEYDDVKTIVNYVYHLLIQFLFIYFIYFVFFFIIKLKHDLVMDF